MFRMPFSLFVVVYSFFFVVCFIVFGVCDAGDAGVVCGGLGWLSRLGVIVMFLCVNRFILVLLFRL